ncbi:MAG: hypothetical protein V1859_00355 [archaeon]
MHDNNARLEYYGAGLNSTVNSEIRLDVSSSKCEVLILNDVFSLKILVDDYVEAEDFAAFCHSNKKRIELNCAMKKKETNYAGLRKLTWKDKKITVSQGGIRVEFGEAAVKKLIDIANIIKDTYSRA